MPVGGKLLLKGGEALQLEKKIRKKKKTANKDADETGWCSHALMHAYAYQYPCYGLCTKIIYNMLESYKYEHICLNAEPIMQ